MSWVLHTAFKYLHPDKPNHVLTHDWEPMETSRGKKFYRCSRCGMMGGIYRHYEYTRKQYFKQVRVSFSNGRGFGKEVMTCEEFSMDSALR